MDAIELKQAWKSHDDIVINPSCYDLKEKRTDTGTWRDGLTNSEIRSWSLWSYGMLQWVRYSPEFERCELNRKPSWEVREEFAQMWKNKSKEIGGSMNVRIFRKMLLEKYIPASFKPWSLGRQREDESYHEGELFGGLLGSSPPPPE